MNPQEPFQDTFRLLSGMSMPRKQRPGEHFPNLDSMPTVYRALTALAVGIGAFILIAFIIF
jgi:hypothetical protein